VALALQVNQTFTHYLKLTPMETVLSSKAVEVRVPALRLSSTRTSSLTPIVVAVLQSFSYSHYGNEHVDDNYASVVFDIDLGAVGIRQWAEYQVRLTCVALVLILQRLWAYSPVNNCLAACLCFFDSRSMF